MGGTASTPRPDARPEEHRDYLLGAMVGGRIYDLSSSFWEKLLLLPPAFEWSVERVNEAGALLAQNNLQTRHFPKLLVHLVWSIQEVTASPGSKSSAVKVINATYFSRVFLKYLIENSSSSFSSHLVLHISDHDAGISKLPEGDLNVPSLVLHGLLTFIGASDINPYTYMLHLELVNLLLVMMSTQLYSPMSAGFHPFLDAAIAQESYVVGPFIRKLLLSFIARTPLPSEAAYYGTQDKETGVIRKMSSAAATVFMLPYYTYTYLLSPGSDRFSKFPLADNSLLLLLVLVHYGKRTHVTPLDNDVEPCTENLAVGLHNPFRRALSSSRDTDFDIADIEQAGQGVRIPFAALFDRLGPGLTEDATILLLYSLVHGNPAFLEYVLVRTDLDTLIMPVLEMLYDVQKRTPNQIYMLLVIFLILSQDSTFNASIHKLALLQILPGVSWYKERLLPGISLGSLMVVILIRTVKFNLSKLRDLFLHTNCLAILANMAPHMHQLNAYASQRLVSLFDMLARKYKKVVDANINVKVAVAKLGQVEGFEASEDMPTELHIYTDFLRIVLEIINAILTYALPRNPEVVYALLHRQELFQPFKEHPRFYELLENIFNVLDFFNVRMDDQQSNAEWSVEKVLQIVIANARSWRGEGMKIFTQLRFTYEEELHPEEFFVPYIWQLVVDQRNIDWNLDMISLFPARSQVEVRKLSIFEQSSANAKSFLLAAWRRPC
ncbi:hypothetical protein SELMODRAFT_87955 [Selaginella moellendorffii]|uniref:Dymeclin n=1 Tax=Selaginella moellendorffii TaxID=88036 RepID=D8R9E1_SELML|nr:hypothetical protein SELMODRAFT_87955 [Selaginella moellendorffii]